MTQQQTHDDAMPEETPEAAPVETSTPAETAADAAPPLTTDEAMAGWQRCMADFDNYRKRQTEDAKEARAWAARAVVEDLLPVVDNFHAATDHVPADHEGSPWVTGILYIRQQLEKVLTDHGVAEISIAPGDAFDPATMEAIETEGESEKEKGEGMDTSPHTVTRVILRGYRMGERVIRAARVSVG